MGISVVELLFTAASAFADAKERAEFLDYACRDDPALRQRLDRLLEFELEADTLFEFQPEVQADGGTAEKRAEKEDIGARIGRYRLITRIGTGGCGVVYHAEQEEPVRRKVALKIVKLGMDTEAVIARFELERQALAQMNHPNIARVLDAGATSSGRPFFVMELVDGERITEFCAANRFNIRQRLELFVHVCRGIEHAHQKGLIHRDIKPSNVLVQWQDKMAVPKVIDFGVAKATASVAASGGGASTRDDHFIGTPSYMSPEQAQGGTDVDTRADIYSLGILLYELLSGRTPFDLERFTGQEIDEIRRVIRDEEPKPPSTALKMAKKSARIAASHGRLVSEVQGDLDWIVMKALEKDRSRRYQTVSGLANDVLRYLNDEVISARPPSRSYRIGKLIRRNKLVFAAASIAVFGLLGGFSVSTVMFFRERAARQEQARLRENAELRELIAHAAVKIRYGDPAGADELLARVPVERTPSSLESADAFGAVANWHVQAGRLKQAAHRFVSAVKAISSVDDSDLPSVSLSVMPAAALVAYAGELERYEDIRQLAVARFARTANPVVAEEILKACLVLPPDKETLQSLMPMRDLVQRAIESKQGLAGTDPRHRAWACFSLSLMYYRAGDLAEAAEWAERCLASTNQDEACLAGIQIIHAMIEHRAGQVTKAQAALAPAREAVQKYLPSIKEKKPPPQGFWYDWVIAAVLLAEAERSIGSD